MKLKLNLVANYLGQGWAALLGLAFVPLYIRFLGMEAYGLIGLFAVLQAWLSLLDMGLAPTLNREMARFTGGAHTAQSIGDLLRSLEILCLGIAVFAGFGVWAASGYLATDWLKTEKLPAAVVAQALSIMAIVIALRFVEGIYRSALFGLQRQVWYNGVNAILALLRWAGAVAVLAWVSPTITAFFLWQSLVSLLSVAAFASGVHQVLPRAPAGPVFSREALAGVWKFAGGMMGITALTLLLTQVDKVILSRMLTLEMFGYYTFAAAVAGVIPMVINPITQACFPRMVELATQDVPAPLASVYHQGAQLVIIVTAPAVLLLGGFTRGLIFMWSGDPGLAEHVSPILSALVLGSFLNGLMWMPYHCQLAHNWTSLAIKNNVIAVLMFIPALLWVIPRHGAAGAAWLWVALNAGYVLVSIQFMHRRLLPDEKWRWYFADVLLPLGGALCVVLVAAQFQPETYQNRWHWFFFLLIAGSLALLAATALASRIRPHLLDALSRLVRGQPKQSSTLPTKL